MNSIFKYLCGVFIVFLFASCKDNDSTSSPSDGQSRTVLVYMVADNSLADFVSDDLTEMTSGMKQVDTSLYNLLVYVDDKSTPVLYRLAKDKKGNVTKVVVKTYNEQDSTNPVVMEDIVNTAFNKYPADTYGLVYWSHGEGWLPAPQATRSITTRWIGQDTNDGNGKTHYMDISELASVLSATHHLDFLLFDACFMLSVEVAYDLREYTDYVMGSPTEIPGPGASYDYLVPAMLHIGQAQTADNNAIQIAKAYYEPYGKKYDLSENNTNDNWTAGASMGALKTSELDHLASATKSVLPASIDNASLAGTVFDYDRRFGSSSFVGYYDMVQLIQNITDSSSFSMWKAAFDKALIYWNTTATNYTAPGGGINFSMKGTYGVSHYIPLASNTNANSAYRKCAWYKAAGWDIIGW